MIETLKIRSITEAEENYSAIISCPTPFNIILIVMAPVIMSSKDPKFWNDLVLKIVYIPIMITAFILFVAYNIILLPIAYIKITLHKLVMVNVYSRHIRISKADKFIEFIAFFAIGWVKLAGNAIADCKYFFIHSWSELPAQKHKQEAIVSKTTASESLSEESLLKLRDLYSSNGEKILPYK